MDSSPPLPFNKVVIAIRSGDPLQPLRAAAMRLAVLFAI
jgi:hypothetical protein